MARRCQDRFVILHSQMRSEQTDGGEGDGSSGERLEHCGKPSCRAGRFDPVVGSAFREMEHLPAVSEERSAALATIQTAGVHFDQTAEQVDRRRALAFGQSDRCREQLVIGDMGEGCR
jgi:hypothetical protein